MRRRFFVMEGGEFKEFGSGCCAFRLGGAGRWGFRVYFRMAARSLLWVG